MQPNQPYDSGWPQPQYPGPPPGPPSAPMPPRRNGGGGRTALVVVLILVALVCLGVPAAAAVVYATTEDGPYTSVDTVYIHVEFTAFTQASEFLGPAECTKVNRDFRDPGIELFNLVVPGLRQSG